MPVLRRPTTCAEGVEQIRLALREVKPTSSPSASGAPAARVLLWNACTALFQSSFVEDGLVVLYEANEIVSFVFNTFVPHIEDRIRYDTLNAEYERAAAKPESVRQNSERFEAILGTLRAADATNRTKTVDERFARMRNAMSALFADAAVREGLCVLYVSSKLARKALDLVMERLISALQNDTSIVSTSEIPMDALFLGSM
jgi:hypothetical protein